MSLTEPCDVRRHQLERLEVGEIAGEEAAALRAHAAGCAGCSRTLEGLAASRRTFASEADPAIESARLLARLEAPSGQDGVAPQAGRGLALRWLAPMALAASLALVVVATRPEPHDRTKGGGAQLTLFVNRAEGPVETTSGVELRSGDQIQFRYAAAGHRYAYVVSVDGRRVISSLYPPAPGTSVSVEPGGHRILPGSIILDDALGPERVFAFFSDAPLSFEQIEANVSDALGDQDVRGLDRVEWDGLDQASVWFLKVP